MQNKFIIENKDVNKRLDVFMLDCDLGLTRSAIKKLIDNGNVLVNGNQCKSGEKLKLNNIVEISYEQEPQNLIAEEIALDIIYEDEQLMVINKPVNLVVHPGSGNKHGTLANALKFRSNNLSDINGEFRPGIVHRLDKDTTGLLLVAKTNSAHLNLAQQIASKVCKRYYKAILLGNLKEEKGVIETNIARDKRIRTRMAVCKRSEGKQAITNYNVLEHFNGFTLVEFELKTGRTHQIRVHCKYIGHPILGDHIYGPVKQPINVATQMLHAYKIEFLHPVSNELMSFTAPLPEYFIETLNKIKNK